ncbi:hypothetical protein, partial [Streptomyces olivaceoviridis]
QAAEEGCARVETRLSLYLSADDLLAGMSDSLALWEHPDPEGLPAEQIRWHTITGLMCGGGPDSPWVSRAAQDARESELFDQMRRMIKRVFGVDVPQF